MTCGRSFGSVARASLLACLVSTAAGCGHANDESSRVTAREEPPVHVRAMRVHRSEETARVRRAAVVEPIRRSVLGTRLMSRALDVRVVEGARVERGEMLVVLDVRDLRARAGQARANQTASAAQMTLADADARRARALGEHGAIASSQLEAAETVLSLHGAAQSGAAAMMAEIGVSLGEGSIRAPFDGVVVAKRIELGQLTVPGAPMIVLEDDSALRVVASIAEDDVDRLAIGHGYRVAFAGRRAATGRLDAIVPSGDPRLPGLTAIFVVDNAAHTLRSGVVASVEVPYPEAAGTVFEVPVRAVVRRGGLAGVYLVADGRARLAWCSIDPSTEGETAVVLDGLGEGDVVVADASVEGLRDARRVEAAF